ncbi:MAG: Foldase protein PrsA [Holosporales bacterium]
MDKNLSKVLLPLAVIAGLGAAYYFMMVKPADNKEATKIEEKKEEPKKEEEKAEAKPEEKKEEAKVEKSDEKKDESKSSDKKDEAAEYKDDSVAAEVDPIGKKITIKDVKAAADMLPAQMRQVPFETIYPILLRQAIDFSILEAEAKKEGFDKKDDVKEAIKEKHKANLFAAYLEKEVDKNVSDDKIKEKYEELKKMIPADEKEFEIAHILLNDEKAAKELIQEIKSGKTTFDAALEKSMDKKSKEDGGKIGYLRRMEVAPDFFEKVSSTKDGDVVSTPLNLGKASSVIRVVSRRAVQVPEFDKIKGELRKSMMPELSMDIVKKLKADSNLKLFSLEGKEIPERTEEELKKQLEESASSVDASKLSPDFVCGEFKDGKITLKDVKAAYDAMPDVLKSMPFEKIYELILTRVATEAILKTAAEKSGLEKDDKVKAQNEVDNRLIVQEAYLKSKAEAKITETDLKTEYNTIVKSINDKNEMEYRIRHIAFKSEEDAKAAFKRLKAGEKFDDLVSLTVDEATKDKKGEVGYVRKQMLPAEVGELVAKTTKGTMINQVVKLNDNLFSIIRVEDKRAVTPPTFDQIKDRLKVGLTGKKALVVIEDLRKNFKIKYFDLPKLPTGAQIEKMLSEISSKMNKVIEKGNLDDLSDKQ